MPRASPISLAEDEALIAFSRSYGQKRKDDPRLPPNLNTEKLKEGILQYDSLQGYHQPGIEIVEQIEQNESTLQSWRAARIFATLTAIVVNIGAAIGLVISGTKLLLASLFDRGNLDQAHTNTSNSFLAGSLAGIANGTSHESWNWLIGAGGMGIFSRFLNKPWGLALFSIFDGLNAIGMGEVKCRDKKNVTPMPHSIFNTPALAPLKFLMPYENAIKSFWYRFTSPRGWKKILSDEPYAIFQSAGGGLISGSAILGVASLFSKKMSETIRSLCYIPYAITSAVNLIALGRDGAVTARRAHRIEDREPMETSMMDIEGWSKLIAAPVIAFNYGLLGLKGLGLFNGNTENIAMGIRAIGVAIANIGFAAQSAVKFAVPDLFGPIRETKFKIIMRPDIVMKHVINMINRTNEKKAEVNGKSHSSDFFEPLINNDTFSELLNRASKTSSMQNLIYKTLTSLPSSMTPIERAVLNRFIHSRRVCAIGVLFYDSLRKNTRNPHLRKYLEDKDLEAAFKLACLTHDNGHSKLPRCHLAETAMHGLLNDELSWDGLCPGSDIYDEVVKYYTEKYGNEIGTKRAQKVLKTAREIIGHKHSLSKLYKWADFCEYGRSKGGDYNITLDFPYWNKEQYEFFADQFRLFADNEGIPHTGFTEVGAVIAFKQIYYRLLFNAYINSHPINLVTDDAYKLGIQNSDLTVGEVFGMSERDFDINACNGTENYKGYTRISNREHFGGRKAYCGYGPKERVYVVNEDADGNIQALEFLKYVELVFRQRDPKLYNALQPMIKILTTPIRWDLLIDSVPPSTYRAPQARARPVRSGYKAVHQPTSAL